MMLWPCMLFACGNYTRKNMTTIGQSSPAMKQLLYYASLVGSSTIRSLRRPIDSFTIFK